MTAQYHYQSVSELLAWDANLLEHDAWEHNERMTIKALNRHGELETYNIVGSISSNPGMFALVRWANSSKHWTWFEAFTDFQALDAANKAKAWREASKAQQIVKPARRNREHEKCYITLHEEITVTCEDTGISYTVRLPIPTALNASLNLPVLHPLAFAENVQTIMQRYSKHGVRIETELEAQVLAGMLLTILRSKNLLICKDAPKANMFLQAATRETLGFAVRWFYGRPSVVNFPALALQLDDASRIREVMRDVPLSPQQKATQEAEVFILNYIKACKGESNKDEAAHIHIQPSKKEQKKVRVYTDLVVQQVKDSQKASKTGENLLAKLVSQHPGQHNLMFGQIKTTLKILAFASSKLREDIARKLRDTFPGNEAASELAVMFAAIKQDAIEDDLLSFTQTIKAEVQDFQATKGRMKFDFMSKIKGGNNA